MSYICKNCEHNNHGWCTLLKRQGLKELSVCPAEPVAEKLTYSESDIERARILGKIEVLYSLIRVMEAMASNSNNHAKLSALKQQIAVMTQSTGFSCKLYDLKNNTHSLIDRSLVESFEDYVEKKKG